MTSRHGSLPYAVLPYSGFSILEFAVTLLLIGIGLVLAMPSLQALSANNQVVTAGNAIVSGMNLARSTAITLGQNVTICPSSDAVTCAEDGWNSGWIVFNDADLDEVADSDEVIRIVSLGSRLEGSGYGEGIVFRADGTTSMAQDAVIRNCYADLYITTQCIDVSVSAFGMIQSTRYDHYPVTGGETPPGGTTGL